MLNRRPETVDRFDKTWFGNRVYDLLQRLACGQKISKSVVIFKQEISIELARKIPFTDQSTGLFNAFESSNDIIEIVNIAAALHQYYYQPLPNKAYCLSKNTPKTIESGRGFEAVTDQIYSALLKNSLIEEQSKTKKIYGSNKRLGTLVSCINGLHYQITPYESKLNNDNTIKILKLLKDSSYPLKDKLKSIAIVFVNSLLSYHSIKGRLNGVSFGILGALLKVLNDRSEGTLTVKPWVNLELELLYLDRICKRGTGLKIFVDLFSKGLYLKLPVQLRQELSVNITFNDVFSAQESIQSIEKVGDRIENVTLLKELYQIVLNAPNCLKYRDQIHSKNTSMLIAASEMNPNALSLLLRYCDLDFDIQIDKVELCFIFSNCLESQRALEVFCQYLKDHFPHNKIIKLMEYFNEEDICYNQRSLETLYRFGFISENDKHKQEELMDIDRVANNNTDYVKENQVPNIDESADALYRAYIEKRGEWTKTGATNTGVKELESGLRSLKIQKEKSKQSYGGTKSTPPNQNTGLFFGQAIGVNYTGEAKSPKKMRSTELSAR